MGFGEINAEIWSFLLEYQLPMLVKNTLVLLLTTAIGVTLLGVSTAWLTAMYRFPGSRLFFWAMMLPLTLPAYVLAFVQVGMFDYTGFISTYLREQYGFEQGLPDIRNMWGLSSAMILTFYPYVYLLARNAFLTMGQQAMEVGASMGLSPFKSVIKVALPMARPWIIGGLLLAMMEVLADELENTGVRVNTLNPGGTRTKMRASAFPAEDPMNLKTPADLMPLYLYLMGADSRGKTGQTFVAQPK